MRIKDTLMIQNYVKANKNRSIWRKFVRAMACLVVFCTTYALILPVITLEQDYSCGLEEHVHADHCYITYEDLPIPCTAEDWASTAMMAPAMQTMAAPCAGIPIN